MLEIIFLWYKQICSKPKTTTFFLPGLHSWSIKVQQQQQQQQQLKLACFYNENVADIHTFNSKYIENDTVFKCYIIYMEWLEKGLKTFIQWFQAIKDTVISG